jgi:hypothetical protein
MGTRHFNGVEHLEEAGFNLRRNKIAGGIHFPALPHATRRKSKIRSRDEITKKLPKDSRPRNMVLTSLIKGPSV